MRKKALKTTKNFFVPKVAQICEISRNFGCFLPGNKDSDPCLEDPDFLSPAKKGQRVGSLNPNPWIRNNTTKEPIPQSTIPGIGPTGQH
jgi:hypothetical protein